MGSIAFLFGTLTKLRPRLSVSALLDFGRQFGLETVAAGLLERLAAGHGLLTSSVCLFARRSVRSWPLQCPPL